MAVKIMSDPILGALREQVECYQRLAKLAELQHEHVQHSRTDELIEVLASRQQMLQQIARHEMTIKPARAGWRGYLDTLDSDDRRSAEHLLAESRRLLESITAADCNDAMVLQQRKLNLGRQIDQAKSARQVNRAYATAAYGSVNGGRMDVQR